MPRLAIGCLVRLCLQWRKLLSGGGEEGGKPREGGRLGSDATTIAVPVDGHRACRLLMQQSELL